MTPNPPPDSPKQPRGLLTIRPDKDHTRRILDRERKLTDYYQRQWLLRWQPGDRLPN